MPAPDLTPAARDVMCPHCRATTRLRPAARFCPHCGGELSRPMADAAAVRALELEAKLAALDRDWLAEREKHLISDRNGGRPKVPEGTSGLPAVFVIVGVLLAIGSLASRVWFGAIVGVVIVVASCVSAAGENNKFDAYDADRRQHLAKRDVLVRELRNLLPDRDWPEIG